MFYSKIAEISDLTVLVFIFKIVSILSMVKALLINETKVLLLYFFRMSSNKTLPSTIIIFHHIFKIINFLKIISCWSPTDFFLSNYPRRSKEMLSLKLSLLESLILGLNYMRSWNDEVVIQILLSLSCFSIFCLMNRCQVWDGKQKAVSIKDLSLFSAHFKSMLL